MTEQEAQEMLAKLRVHYGQPVMPVRTYCEALENWRRAIEANNRSVETEHRDPYRQGAQYHEVLHRVFTDMRKSALLWRLIYAGEKFRTVKCPEHKGHLNMGEWIGDGSRGGPCTHGCQGTGWLPEP